MLILVGGCRAGIAPRPEAAQPPREVVVYTSLDRPYAEPVLRAFERESGLRVREVYDTEATKSLGLANRIAAERNRPRADVFWSSEVIRVIGLKAQGVLAPYASPSAADIPARFKDPEGYWTGFAARARVLVYNKKLVSRPPRSRFDLEKPEWRGAVAMANPLFGTTATEAAALFEVLGPEAARAHYRALQANGLRIVNGNSVAADWTARGEVRAALTDTDDALTRIRAGAPLGMVYPDQGRTTNDQRPTTGRRDASFVIRHPSSVGLPRDASRITHHASRITPSPSLVVGRSSFVGLGTLLIPNTVTLVKGGPNGQNGRRLIDYLLNRNVEGMLAKGGARQIPLRAGVPIPPGTPRLSELAALDVDFARVAARAEEVDAFLKDLFQR